MRQIGDSMQLSIKQQQLRLREDAILDTANRLLAARGYELMSMDELAEAVGVAKGSIYKHFPSKESLAAACMIRLMQRASALLDGLPADMTAVQRLRSVLRWALESRLEGGLPLLPSTSPTLQAALMSSPGYLSEVMRLNSRVKALVKEARADGALRADLASDVILYSIYSRTCDPALDYLIHASGFDGHAAIEQLIEVLFAGIGAG